VLEERFSETKETQPELLTHHYSLAFALCFAAEFHQFCRERQTAQERAEALITLATEQGLTYFVVRGIIARGWALAEQGQGEDGIAQVRQGLAAYRTTGAELYQSHFLAMLAEAYGKVGRTEEGLAAVAEALDWAHSTGGRYYEAELYRLKGELVLQSGVRCPASENTSPQPPTPKQRRRGVFTGLSRLRDISRRSRWNCGHP